MRTSLVLLSLACCIMLLAAGCTQTSFGTRAPVGFGASAEDQQIIDCLKAKYGEPCSEGPPRFVEPIIATQLNERNLPENSVVKLNKDTRSIYFWVFFDRFQPKDPVTLSMKYIPTNQVVDSVEKTPEGNCGAIHAEYLMPEGGWPLGQYEITISGRGTTATQSFEVISGATVTGPLPYSPEMCPGASGGVAMGTTSPAGFGAAATTQGPVGTATAPQGFSGAHTGTTTATTVPGGIHTAATTATTAATTSPTVTTATTTVPEQASPNGYWRSSSRYLGQIFIDTRTSAHGNVYWALHSLNSNVHPLEGTYSDVHHYKWKILCSDYPCLPALDQYIQDGNELNSHEFGRMKYFNMDFYIRSDGTTADIKYSLWTGHPTSGHPTSVYVEDWERGVTRITI